MKNVKSFSKSLFVATLLLLSSLCLRAQVAEAIGELTEVSPDVNSATALKFDYNSTDYCFREGLCAISKNNLWGFIDTTGKWIIEPIYFQWGKQVPYFSDGICVVGKRAADGYSNIPVYIDKKGMQLLKTQNFVQASPFSEGIAVVGKESGPGKLTVYSFINTQGVQVQGTMVPNFKGSFFEFGPYSDGLTSMWDDKLNSYGFIDTKGKWVLKPENRKWNDAAQFSEGRCAVQNTINFYWGYIDKTGATKVAFDYANKPDMFSNGLALVKNSKFQAGYINKEGNLALGYKYTQNSFGFHQGYALVTLDVPELTLAIIDTTGKVIKTLESAIDPVVNTDGSIVYQPKNQDGLRMLAPDGTILIRNAMYQKIDPFSENRAYVEFYESGSQSGFINRKGELIILRTE
jgi:hypothetical protein